MKEDKHISPCLAARGLNTGKTTGSPCSPSLRSREHLWMEMDGRTETNTRNLKKVFIFPKQGLAKPARWDKQVILRYFLPSSIWGGNTLDALSQEEMLAPASSTVLLCGQICPAGAQHMCWAALPASTTTVYLAHSSNWYLKLQLPLLHIFREVFLSLSSWHFDL